MQQAFIYLAVLAAGVAVGIVLSHLIITRATEVYNGLLGDLHKAESKAKLFEANLRSLEQKLTEKVRKGL